MQRSSIQIFNVTINPGSGTLGNRGEICTAKELHAVLTRFSRPAVDGRRPDLEDDVRPLRYDAEDGVGPRHQEVQALRGAPQAALDVCVDDGPPEVSDEPRDVQDHRCG